MAVQSQRFYTLIKLQGGSMAAWLPEAQLISRSYPQFFASSSPMNNRDLAVLGPMRCMHASVPLKEEGEFEAWTDNGQA